MASFTRKQVSLLLSVMLLVGCSPVASPTVITPKLPTPTTTVTPIKLPTPTITVTPTPYPTLSPVEALAVRIQNFLGIDVSCPHLCWYGINPGVTSAAGAHAILGDDLVKRWDDSTGGGVTIENGLVKSISIGSSSSEIGFVMSDFIALLGDPAEIRIDVFSGHHCDPSSPFFVYYPSRKLTLYVRFSDAAHGPDLRDDVSGMILNSEFDDGAFDNGIADTADTISLDSYYPLDRTKHPFKRQPWLGFGHIHDYLSGRSWYTCQP